METSGKLTLADLVDRGVSKEALKRIPILAGFMNDDLSFCRGAGARALAALEAAGLGVSQAMVSFDRQALKKAGVTSLSQWNFGGEAVVAREEKPATERKPRKPRTKRSASVQRSRPDSSGTPDLDALIAAIQSEVSGLEAQIEQKRGDLEKLQAAAEVMKRRA